MDLAILAVSYHPILVTFIHGVQFPRNIWGPISQHTPVIRGFWNEGNSLLVYDMQQALTPLKNGSSYTVVCRKTLTPS